MSNLKEIEAIHKISEVLAEAFAKVKFISGQYLSTVQKEQPRKVQKTSKPDTEKNTKNSKPIEQTTVAEKSGKEGKTEQKKAKQSEKKQTEKKEAHPDRPKKPVSAFFRFNNQNLNKVKGQYPQLSHTEVVTLISQIWGQLQQQEKQPYQNLYKEDLKKYDQEMKKFYARHPEEKTKKMLKEENRKK